MYKKLQPKHVLKVGVISFPIASVMSQTQNGPKHEKLSLQEKLYGIFFFFFPFPFDKVNKYIDLFTIQIRVLWHIYKQYKLQSHVSKYT